MDKGTPDSSLIESAGAARLGPHGVLTDPADNRALLRRLAAALYHGHTPAVLRPATGSRKVADGGGASAPSAAVAIVPQGGKHQHGRRARRSARDGSEIVLSLCRE